MARQPRARPRATPRAGLASIAPTTSTGRTASPDVTLDEIESVAQIGSYAYDLIAGRWVSSKGLDAIFGIDAGFERTVEGWTSLVHPADSEAMIAYVADEVVGRAQPFDREYRIIRADTGEARWVHGRGTLRLDGAGRPVRLIGTIADITEQHHAQEALRASEARYAAIFEGTAEAILIADATTYRYRWVNAAACALLGYTRDELLGMRVHDLHPAADLPTILAKVGEVADGQITEGRGSAVPAQGWLGAARRYPLVDRHGRGGALQHRVLHRCHRTARARSGTPAQRAQPRRGAADRGHRQLGMGPRDRHRPAVRGAPPDLRGGAR